MGHLWQKRDTRQGARGRLVLAEKPRVDARISVLPSRFCVFRSRFYVFLRWYEERMGFITLVMVLNIFIKMENNEKNHAKTLCKK
jgi:hypothetical protein